MHLYRFFFCTVFNRVAERGFDGRTPALGDGQLLDRRHPRADVAVQPGREAVAQRGVGVERLQQVEHVLRVAQQHVLRKHDRTAARARHPAVGEHAVRGGGGGDGGDGVLRAHGDVPGGGVGVAPHRFVKKVHAEGIGAAIGAYAAQPAPAAAVGHHLVGFSPVGDFKAKRDAVLPGQLYAADDGARCGVDGGVPVALPGVGHPNHGAAVARHVGGAHVLDGCGGRSYGDVGGRGVVHVGRRRVGHLLVAADAGHEVVGGVERQPLKRDELLAALLPAGGGQGGLRGHGRVPVALNGVCQQRVLQVFARVLHADEHLALRVRIYVDFHADVAHLYAAAAAAAAFAPLGGDGHAHVAVVALVEHVHGALVHVERGVHREGWDAHNAVGLARREVFEGDDAGGAKGCACACAVGGVPAACAKVGGFGNRYILCCAAAVGVVVGLSGGHRAHR